MKEIVNKIIFVFSIILIGIFSVVFIVKKPIIFSENENRYLAAFPTFTISKLIEGKFVRDIENYANDQFPIRDILVGLKTNVEVLLGKRKINDIYIARDNYLIPSFNKNNDYNKIISSLNSLVSKVMVPVDLMITPNAIEIYKEKLPLNNEEHDGIQEIEKIYNSFDGKSINIHNTFLKNKNNYDLYYRTDHHWTTYGAFIAYNTYLNSLGKMTKNLTEYNIKLVSNNFYGTSYSKSNYYSIPADEIYIFQTKDNYLVNYVIENKIENSLYNFEYLNKKDKYSIFLDNNHALIEINNLNNINEENLLLIKNSYGNSFVPFIAQDYKKISVIDLRYYKEEVSSYIEENNIDRVLILYDINGIYTDSSIYRLR